GSVTEDVPRQLARLPTDATHFIVSVGGNDALHHVGLLYQEAGHSVADALFRLADIHEQFRQDYREMLVRVLEQERPTSVCTIYDAIPGLGRDQVAGLTLFNDVILREAFRAGAAAIDLRLVCTEPADYAASSPIEPSTAGGGKIARAIGRLLGRW